MGHALGQVTCCLVYFGGLKQNFKTILLKTVFFGGGAGGGNPNPDFTIVFHGENPKTKFRTKAQYIRSNLMFWAGTPLKEPQ